MDDEIETNSAAVFFSFLIFLSLLGTKWKIHFCISMYYFFSRDITLLHSEYILQLHSV